MKLKRLVLVTVFALLTVGLTVGTTWAKEIKINPVAEVLTGPSGVSFNPVISYDRLDMVVTRPDEVVFRKSFPAGSIPSFELGASGLPVMDGLYKYELVVVTNKKDRKDISISTNKLGPVKYKNNSPVQSGAFTVLNGSIVADIDENPTTNIGVGPDGATSETPDRTMDIQHLDDVIITFSLCVGNDCVNGENFGFDTVRLKENNLRLHFDDTSNSASFPNNDWRITINDSSNGGANYFAVEDATAGRIPFRVEAGAPANTLYVEADGDVGIKTSNPVVDLHVVEGNTPTLRLEQDGSDGFTPQTWDVAGNEANFFIRDVTNGSRLSFRIEPGAPESSIHIDNNGAVGFGTSNPTSNYTIHAYRTSDNARIVAERSGGSITGLFATNNAGLVGTLNDNPMRITVNNLQKVQFNSDNSVDYFNGATITSGGVFTNASSRELKENIKEIDAKTAMEAFQKLNPVTYNYKVDKKEQVAGFIAEDVPEIVATNNRKGIAAIEVTALLTKVLKEQQKTIDELKKEIKELKENKDK
jgi:hypothetical protein